MLVWPSAGQQRSRYADNDRYDDTLELETIEEDNFERYLERLYDIYDLEVEAGRMFGGARTDIIRDPDSIKDKLKESDLDACFVQARPVLGEVHTQFLS